MEALTIDYEKLIAECRERAEKAKARADKADYFYHLKCAEAIAAPVVRCRECKYSKPPAILTQRYGVVGTLTCTEGPCNRRNVGSDFFCGHGKRKEKAQDGMHRR